MFLLWLIEKKCEEIESKFIEYKKSKVRKKIPYQEDMSPIRLLDGSLYYPKPPTPTRISPSISLHCPEKYVIDTDIETSQVYFYETNEEVTRIKKSRKFYKNYISRRKNGK